MPLEKRLQPRLGAAQDQGVDVVRASISRERFSPVGGLESAELLYRLSRSTIELVDRAIMLAAREMQLPHDVRRRQLKE